MPLSYLKPNLKAPTGLHKAHSPHTAHQPFRVAPLSPVLRLAGLLLVTWYQLAHFPQHATQVAASRHVTWVFTQLGTKPASEILQGLRFHLNMTRAEPASSDHPSRPTAPFLVRLRLQSTEATPSSGKQNPFDTRAFLTSRSPPDARLLEGILFGLCVPNTQDPSWWSKSSPRIFKG